MDDVAKQAALSALRSLLIVAGSSLAAHGFLDSGAVNEVVGAVMVIIPIVWGVWQKYQAEAKSKTREVIAVNAGIAVSNAEPSITPPVPAAVVPEILKTFAPPTEVKP